MGAGLNGIIFDDLSDKPVMVYLQVEYVQNGASYGESYCRTVIGNHT